MAHPDLNFIPVQAARAFVQGQEFQALTALRRAQAGFASESVEWAQLERLIGLLLIHVQREVEGTFCLERADARLDRLHACKPDLLSLEARVGADALESPP